MSPDRAAVFFETCSEKVACLFSINLIKTRAWDLVDDLMTLWGWDGVFNVNQIGSQGGVGFVGNLTAPEGMF